LADEIKLYPLLVDILRAMMKHLPQKTETHRGYFGNFTFTVAFRDGVPYKVKDVWGERSIDMEKLKEMLK